MKKSPHFFRMATDWPPDLVHVVLEHAMPMMIRHHSQMLTAFYWKFEWVGFVSKGDKKGFAHCKGYKKIGDPHFNPIDPVRIQDEGTRLFVDSIRNIDDSVRVVSGFKGRIGIQHEHVNVVRWGFLQDTLVTLRLSKAFCATHSVQMLAVYNAGQYSPDGLDYFFEGLNYGTSIQPSYADDLRDPDWHWRTWKSHLVPLPYSSDASVSSSTSSSTSST